MKAQHISLDVVRAGNIASISRKIRTLAWCLWVDLTGQGHHHGDHSIKSTWYCGHKPMNYNASPIMSFVMLCVPSSCCSVSYWREVLRFLTFRHFASVQHFVRDLSCDQRFARAHNMRAEVWWLYLWEVPWFYLGKFPVPRLARGKRCGQCVSGRGDAGGLRMWQHTHIGTVQFIRASFKI